MNYFAGVFETEILRINGGLTQTITDQLAIEEPLEIVARIQTKDNTLLKNISVTMRTPGQDEYLTAGFLFTEGIVDRKTDIRHLNNLTVCAEDELNNETIIVDINPELAHRLRDLERHFYASSSCGVCGKASIDLVTSEARYIPKKVHDVLSPELLNSLPDRLRERQKLFSMTGGIHACALFDLEGNLIYFAEDIGRHNAMDKLIGWGLMNDRLPFSDEIILLSGRASFEMIQKAMHSGVHTVAAVGAPSSLAVQTADNFGLTLIGFLSEKKMNVYSHNFRIKHPASF
ncbi:MAG: formate dehydrogenase accessory sulfurtransferase FdhD [Saprospiraceae bacterium]|nr:formate dehydrogenase accessory sulfurtransferase FdhD [Saprospiraceae bacterium]HMX87183.1 formate dehydrogenase accessory sulfurtransferase FdhD [Saprospiraceae bacterium]HMZ38737.1 formate dehydrogenase accessory sulfurtransferase FdhD [Saprospiraceae bacterium]HNA65218.1 formate dehydrogenase accessory sulfurtransferase FdhD [Saprospiraceae bacterium]HNB31893.1 formate dehydrogenase accessory sulfurtransferase FdhD [Saprospiraceae bacterium]